MKYTFKCPQCQESNEYELTIAEYADFEAVCERCTVKMERVYEMPQVSGSEENAPGEGQSCSGMCSSCSSCGL